MSPVWRIDLFGGLRVRGDGQEIQRFRTQKVAGLLGYLAFTTPLAHSREHLIERFWPEMEIDRGQNGLRVTLSSLRRQLEPPGVPAGSVIRSDRIRVGLDPDSISIDVQAFEGHLRAARGAGNPFERIRFLTRAVELYRGPLLAGLYDDWIFPEQDRLASLHREALLQLLRSTEERGDVAAALHFAHRAVELDPLDEEPRRELIRLARISGQPSLALRSYREWEERLREEGCGPPSARMRKLLAEIEGAPPAPPSVDRPSVPEPSIPADAPAEPRRSGHAVTLFMAARESASSEDNAADRAAWDAFLAQARRWLRPEEGAQLQEAEGILIVAFDRVRDAVAFGRSLQQSLDEAPAGSLPTRMGMAIDTREIAHDDGIPDSSEMNDALALQRAAHPGQILLSERAASLLRLSPPAEYRLKDLGSLRLHPEAPMERLYQLEWEGMPAREFPPLRAEVRPAAPLPPRFTRFFGREGEQERLLDLLRPPAPPSPALRTLVTVTGIGGCGKTRLALEVAGRCLEPFRGSVWFVPLADVKDPSLLFDVLHSTLRLPRSTVRDTVSQIVEALSASPTLLVLDNFEQIVDGGAAGVKTLLERVPSLTCLVTSRRLLGLEGEREFFLKPLATPDGEETLEAVSRNESIRLFVDRAQAVRPDFQITAANYGTLAEVCHRLEGIPLALELAAARSGLLTPAQLLAQLSQRYEFLVSRRRDANDRHRTLRGAVDWSFQMLPEPLQRLLARLSVFRGGWSLGAARSVCAPGLSDYSIESRAKTFEESPPPDPETLEGLEYLRECSLLHLDEPNGEIRYSLLETIREYASERLREFGESETAHRRHLDHFALWAEWMSWHVNGKDQAKLLPEMDLEQDNCRAAMEWGIAHAPEQALALASTLGSYWIIRDHWRRGAEWMKRVLQEEAADLPTDPSGPDILALDPETAARAALDEPLELDDADALLSRVRALRWLAVFEGNMGYLDDSERHLRKALKLSFRLEDKEFTAATWCDLGEIATYRGDYAAARAYFQGSHQLRWRIRQWWGAADALKYLGIVATAEGDYETAREVLGRSLDLFREHGNATTHARLDVLLGIVSLHQGDLETAEGLFERSWQWYLASEHRHGCLYALKGKGEVAFLRGDLDEAVRRFEECLTGWREVGNREGIAGILEGLARAAAASRKGPRAARLFGAARALRRVVQAPLPPNERPAQESWIARIRQSIGEDAFDRAFAAGETMSWEDAVAYALRQRGV